MTEPLEETPRNHRAQADLWPEGKSVIAIGPGLGRDLPKPSSSRAQQ